MEVSKVNFRRLAAGTAIAVVVVVIAAFGLAWLAPTGSEPLPPVAGVPSDLPATVTHGEYLAKAADCVACHTAEGGTPFAGGRPFKLPFGTIYATNLTPDQETGIGGWSDDAFVRAVREGIGSHGHLYPAMPYTSYSAMSREDVLAIKGYLFTLKPVHQETQRAALSFPFNQRWGMAFWNIAFFGQHRFTADPTKDATWNRGAYLATALGHCGECHTPRNAGFAMQSHDYLAGTVVEGWKAYNTTSEASYGIGAWTDEQVEGFLWRGHAPGRSSAAGPMAEVVENSLQYLTASDIKSMVAYLRSVTPATGDKGGTITLAPAAALASNAVLPGPDGAPGNPVGRQLFAGDCAGCHQWNGAGRQTNYASLVGSHAVNDPTGLALVQVLLHGTHLQVGTRNQMMPGFGGAYSDADIAAVANFVLGHFGSKQGTVTAAQVAEQRTVQ
jgi:mono/diheme cytochrome c family protein